MLAAAYPFCVLLIGLGFYAIFTGKMYVYGLTELETKPARLVGAAAIFTGIAFIWSVSWFAQFLG